VVVAAGTPFEWKVDGGTEATGFRICLEPDLGECAPTLELAPFTCTSCIISCRSGLEANPTLVSGVYLICGQGGNPQFNAYCDMETSGGGWMLVANINPADGHVLTYHSNFWCQDREVGSLEERFTKDYKGVAAWTAHADELMIQSADFGDDSAEIKGWRVWPMTEASTFIDLFKPCGTTKNRCTTGEPTEQQIGTTSEWDNIIRRCGCLWSNKKYGGSGDFSRLTVMPEQDDDVMGGFSAGIDGGEGDTNVMDHAACRQDRCQYNEITQLTDPNTGTQGDCTGSYCHGGNYNQDNPGWTSRFYVREKTPLTPEVIASMNACEEAGRYYTLGDRQCVDIPPCDTTTGIVAT
jgi:hypothetical protein